ncbi:MAG: serine/threonine protein kinase [Phycisphaerae bacterium]|nr:serine/threonine protein kinase [Phycisphaerae bacterium]
MNTGPRLGPTNERDRAPRPQLDATIDHGALDPRAPGLDMLRVELLNREIDDRIRDGKPVDLRRLLELAPRNEQSAEWLDAAIDGSLRSRMALTGETIERAAGWLISRHPDLRYNIRLAASLSSFLTSGTPGPGESGPEAAPLPRDFGPPLPSGAPRYRLWEQLGRGAHGTVYLAVDGLLSEEGRPARVAIKVINRTEADDTRWLEEAAGARRVEHANVVRVLDAGVTERGERYLVSELVTGGDLVSHVRSRGSPPSPRDAARLVAAVCRGIQAAHSAGVIHRDIKPANILIDESGRPRVVDFGIAARTGGFGPSVPTAFQGTLAFASPEQFRGDAGPATPLSDVYALGGLLYWLLTGSCANGDSPQAVATNLANPMRRAPSVRDSRSDVGEDLDAITSRALATRLADRYGSAEALAADLEAWLEHRPILWRKPSMLRRAWLAGRREPFAAASLVGAALVLSATTAWIATSSARTREAQRRAEAAVELAKAEVDAANWKQRAAESEKKKIETWHDSTTMALGATLQYMREQRKTLASDWLPILTILEAVAGPALFSRPNAKLPDLWSERIAYGQSLARDAFAENPSDFEALLWSSVVGFWQMRADDSAGAKVTLTTAARAWDDARWPRDDRWRKRLSVLLACAELFEARAGRSDSDSEREARALLLSPETDSLVNHTNIRKLIDAALALGPMPQDAGADTAAAPGDPSHR